MLDQWLPLQGVNKGEIHIQVTRRIPETQPKASSEADPPKLVPVLTGNTKLQRNAGKVRESICIFLLLSNIRLDT